MSTNETEQTDELKKAIDKGDETLKPISVDDLLQPTGELQETSARREWQIKRLQEKLGVSRDIAEKMVDEGTHL
jgi:hypothetical protein